MKRLRPIRCPTCDVAFQPRRSRVVFCSRRCKTLKQWDRRFDEYKGPSKPVGKCGHCCRTMQLAARGLCVTCYRTPGVMEQFAKRKTGPECIRAPRACPVCDKTFPPRTETQTYCSRECVGKAKRLPHNGISVEDRNRLLLENLDTARAWAIRLHRTSAAVRAYGSVDDVKSLGLEVLVRLIEHYDPARHGELPRFLCGGVRTGILNACHLAARRQYRPDLGLLVRRLYAGTA